jgi:hypothetical protein
VIDLSRTRAELLAEIGAPQPSGGPVRDITDPEVVTANVRVRLRGRERDDLFPLLKVALSERFCEVPRSILIRDLFMPLRHAVGNADRHGNQSDPAREITVEVVLAPRGALLAVSDEGDGFDVRLAVERMQQEQTYFAHKGMGFRGLHGASSPVTWENGGRTLLLCFRPPSNGARARFREVEVPGAIPGEARGDDPVLRRLVDRAWIQTCLSRELPALRNGHAKLESCQSYLSGGPGGDDCGIRYVLRIATTTPERPVETRTLTARLHAEEATATADFEAAAGLHGAQGWKDLRIPMPVARLEAERRLVLYEFDPWMNLWQYLRYRDSLKSLRHSAKRVGSALATLHRSRPLNRLPQPGPVEKRFQAMVSGAVSALEGLPGAAELVRRFRASIQRLQDLPLAPRPGPCTPAHGALGWDRIHCGVDGYFYFYRFETCQLSDPGIDLGGFAADLLRFTLSRGNPAGYRVCCEDLLAHYNAKAEHPMEQRDLPFYVALAIGERLGDAQVRAKADAEELLAALDATHALARADP